MSQKVSWRRRQRKHKRDSGVGQHPPSPLSAQDNGDGGCCPTSSGFHMLVDPLCSKHARIPLCHLYTHHGFCLGINGELLMQLHKNASLVAFVEGPVRSYLYSAVFHEVYGRYPFGDRPHGSQGILDFYKERFEVEDELSAYQIMQFIAKGKYRGHLQCPCGSGIRARNCHGDQLLSAINSFERETVMLDLWLILKDLQALEEHRRRLQIPKYIY